MESSRAKMPFRTDDDVRAYVRKRKRANKNCSVSHLRRALNIGYKKAKRIHDEVEEELRSGKLVRDPVEESASDEEQEPAVKVARPTRAAARRKTTQTTEAADDDGSGISDEVIREHIRKKLRKGEIIYVNKMRALGITYRRARRIIQEFVDQGKIQKLPKNYNVGNTNLLPSRKRGGVETRSSARLEAQSAANQIPSQQLQSQQLQPQQLQQLGGEPQAKIAKTEPGGGSPSLSPSLKEMGSPREGEGEGAKYNNNKLIPPKQKAKEENKNNKASEDISRPAGEEEEAADMASIPKQLQQQHHHQQLFVSEERRTWAPSSAAPMDMMSAAIPPGMEFGAVAGLIPNVDELIPSTLTITTVPSVDAASVPAQLLATPSGPTTIAAPAPVPTSTTTASSPFASLQLPAGLASLEIPNISPDDIPESLVTAHPPSRPSPPAQHVIQETASTTVESHGSAPAAAEPAVMFSMDEGGQPKPAQQVSEEIHHEQVTEATHGGVQTSEETVAVLSSLLPIDNADTAEMLLDETSGEGTIQVQNMEGAVTDMGAGDNLVGATSEMQSAVPQGESEGQPAATESS